MANYSQAECAERLEKAGGGMETIKRWFSWRSHSPERRAQSAVTDYANEMTSALAGLAAAGASPEECEQWAEGYVRKWLAYQHAGSRTANPMVTGPANFPADRNRKRMETEHKRSVEFSEYAGGWKAWLARRARSAEKAAASEAAKGMQFEEHQIGDVRLVRNTAIDRIQFLFPGKPDDETRQQLKRNGFRWSPREGAWQRQLTNNGIDAARRIRALLMAAVA